MTETLYQPPLVRVSAKYEPAPGGGPTNIDVEINDAGVASAVNLVRDLVSVFLTGRDPMSSLQVTTTSQQPPPRTYVSPNERTLTTTSTGGAPVRVHPPSSDTTSVIRPAGGLG